MTQLIDAQHTNSFKLETKMKLRGRPNKSDSPATIKAKEKAKEPEEKTEETVGPQEPKMVGARG